MQATSELDQLLSRGVAEVIVEASVRQRLAEQRPLRLKQGFDPTRPDLHLGHAVGLRKLRAFQELGHQVVLVVGDWTAQIGDPSGRDTTRQRLSAAEVERNAVTYMQQFFQIVDRQHTEVRWQSEWYGTFKLDQLLELASAFTLGQLLAHETFRNRQAAGAPLSILELIYPMLQANDSVVIAADIEFGGTDQKFNNLAGRQLMEHRGMRPQDVLLVPLIPGLDGRKMSKSLGNTIDLALPAFELFSRIMALPDQVLPLFFETLTDLPAAQLAELHNDMPNPMQAKRQLGHILVTSLHSAAIAQQVEAAWVRQFSQRELPDCMPEFPAEPGLTLLDLLVNSRMVGSRSEARRLISAGAVRIDGLVVQQIDAALPVVAQTVVQIGRRRFVRVVPIG